jgi:hypothetical protein
MSIIMVTALAFDLCSEAAKFLHYSMYSYDGEGFLALDIIG